MGYYKKGQNNNAIYHAIQLTDLDFESKINQIVNNDDGDEEDDDDDEKIFGTSISPKSNKRKHNLSHSESSDSSSNKPSFTNTTQNKKKKKATKTSITDKTDEPTKIKHEITYEKLPAAKALASLNDNQPIQYNPYFNPNLQSPSQPYYYPYSYYPPPPQNMLSSPEVAIDKNDNNDKKSVQFNVPEDNIQQNNTDKSLNHEQDTESIQERGGTKAKRGRKAKASTSTSNPTRRSPRNKGGILNMAVNKITDDDDGMQLDDAQIKNSESFSTMDTESDYNTQNEEIPDENDISD
jgi:hypothetical protein